MQRTLYPLALAVFLASCSQAPLPKDLPAAERGTHRHIDVPGTVNLRDLGGYTTADGLTTKWGVLYRSDALSKVTEAGQRQLTALSLAEVIDFRANFERDADPDRLPANFPAKVLHLPIFDNNNSLGPELRKLITEGKVEGIDPDALLTQANVQFVEQYSKEYTAFLKELLAAGGKPVLFHCTAGKDRAGFASALVLKILGVSDQQIRADYLLSDKPSRQAHSLEILLLRVFKGNKSGDVVEGLMGAKEAYLQAAFDAIAKHYGTFDNYVSQGLGLTAADVQKLKGLLLEKV